MVIPKGSTKFNVTVTSADTTSGLTIRSGVASQKIYVTDLIISVDTASNYQLQDSDATVVMEQIYLAANSGLAKSFEKHIEVASGKDLEIHGAASGNVSVTAHGYQL